MKKQIRILESDLLEDLAQAYISGVEDHISENVRSFDIVAQSILQSRFDVQRKARKSPSDSPSNASKEFFTQEYFNTSPITNP